jgi:tellurite resistance protein
MRKGEPGAYIEYRREGSAFSLNRGQQMQRSGKMNKTEKYLELMLLVLKADGIIDERERALIYRMIKNVGMKDELVQKYDARLKIDNSEDREQILTEIASDLDPATLTGMVRDAYIMADADNNIHPAEVQVINDFLAKAGIPGERFKEIETWARKNIAHLKRGQRLMTRPGA